MESCLHRPEAIAVMELNLQIVGCCKQEKYQNKM